MISKAVSAVIQERKWVSNVYNTNANIAKFYFVVQHPNHVTPLLSLSENSLKLAKQHICMS